MPDNLYFPSEDQPSQRRSQRPFFATPLGIALALAVLAAALLWRFWPIWPFDDGALHDRDFEHKPVVARGALSDIEQSTIELFEKRAPSVVYITTTRVQRNLLGPLFTQEIPEGTGSGFVWDAAKGYIVTNFHVIQNADTATVTLADGSSYPASLVGSAPDQDLAVLKIKVPSGRKLQEIPVGTSQKLKVGQSVYAIGNPFGLDQTLTTGIISALNREIQSVTRRPITGVIQTDAAINPGNSGGPLLDSAGLLIGVNTAIYSPSGANAGIGFAIPVDSVNRVVTEIIRHGGVSRPGLGVQIVDDRISRRVGIPKGVLVREVQPGSAAERAGLRGTIVNMRQEIAQLGDVIVAIDGQDVNGADDLLRLLSQKRVGDTVTVSVLRNGQPLDLRVTLQEIG
ncbi:MAG: S1C family serine protease [Gemmataceae bacterium]